MSWITKCLPTQSLRTGSHITQFLPPVRGMKFLKPPPKYPDIEIPENRKLPVVPKVPMYPHGVKPPKMKAMLQRLHEPEQVHNTLMYKQYGLMSVNGGRMTIKHFDAIRNHFVKKLDYKRMFAVWRVDAPWQAMTKRPVGFTLGGGKGNIHHYCTPLGPNRVIVEVGGQCDYCELEYILKVISDKMPFKCRPVSQQILEDEAKKEKEDAEKNMNRYTYEYMIKNNMLGCRKFVKEIDYKYFGKYI